MESLLLLYRVIASLIGPTDAALTREEEIVSSLSQRTYFLL
jgi:hypothetical protein